MKSKLFMFLAVAFLGFNSMNAQMDGERKSPAATTEVKAGDATVTIKYSQPSMRGRTIYGDLVPYGKVWRTGANEATTISCDKDIEINGNKLAAGTYALFTIPGEKEWTVIVNSDAGQWGAYSYKEKKNVLTFKVKPSKTEVTEMMTFIDGKAGKVYLDWEQTRITLEMK